MMIKLKQLISGLLHLKKAPTLDNFGEVEVSLMKATPKARDSFKQNLREQLKARHQEICEAQLEKKSGFFYVHRFATSAALAVILVVGGGSVIVSASGAPIPKNMPINNITPGWHPDVAPITIQFDKRMMQGSVEDSFSISPAVSGNFVWDNGHEMMFLPDQPLNPNQEYVITISQNAKSLFQKPMDAPFEQKINVFSPELPPRINELRTQILELRQNSQNLTGAEKDDLINQIKELENELGMFFEESQRPTKNPVRNQVQTSSA